MPGDLRWFDARVGDRMIDVLRAVDANGTYPSVTSLAKDVYPDATVSPSKSPVARCLNRGLLERDPDHPATGEKSQGAILITEQGRRLVRLHAPPEGFESTGD